MNWHTITARVKGTLTCPVRWLSAWAWAKEIETCEAMVQLKAFEMDEAGLDLKIQQDPMLAQYVAKCFASMVASSPNYTEMKFDLCGKWAGKHEWMTVLIQKGNGKTPHELREFAERELARLRSSPPNPEISGVSSAGRKP
jgi:hypothetical protein